MLFFFFPASSTSPSVFFFDSCGRTRAEMNPAFGEPPGFLHFAHKIWFAGKYGEDDRKVGVFFFLQIPGSVLSQNLGNKRKTWA